MFVRIRPSGPRKYENRWEDGRLRQYVIATLDRLKAREVMEGIRIERR